MMMRLVVLALAVLLLAGCAALLVEPTPAPTATPSHTPTPAPTAPALGPGGRVVMTLAPDARPTSAAPLLQLDIEVLDASTRRRVDGALISVDGAELPRGCCASVAVDGTRPHTVTVTAEGYWLWSVTLNPHIEHDQTLRMPVELAPKLPEG